MAEVIKKKKKKIAVLQSLTFLVSDKLSKTNEGVIISINP